MSSVPIKLGHNNRKFVVNIWDTAGQERFRSLVPLFVRDADLVVLAFSMACIESFDHLDFWFEQIRTEMKVTCPVIIVGNQIDLDPAIGEAEVKEWCKDHQCPVLFVSAKTGANVKSLFELIAELLANAGSRHVDPKVALADPVPEKNCC
jgi:small GTP-binding protein